VRRRKMEKITYEQMEKMYRKATSGDDQPQWVFGTEPCLRAIFGDEAVDTMIIRGDIKCLKMDDDLEVLRATP
jgi:hypothetical protein